MSADDAHEPGLVAHLERFLGPIGSGWSTGPDGERMPFQVARYTTGSDADSVPFSTLGLSRPPLLSPTSGRAIRLEQLMLAPRVTSPDDVASLLLQVGTRLLASGRAILRGEVIGPAGPLVAGATCTALYASMPAYFPDEFATCSDASGDVAIVWLVPITTSEAEYVASHGWRALEDRLAEYDPDLVDFRRPALPLCPE